MNVAYDQAHYTLVGNDLNTNSIGNYYYSDTAALAASYQYNDKANVASMGANTQIEYGTDIYQKDSTGRYGYSTDYVTGAGEVPADPSKIPASTHFAGFWHSQPDINSTRSDHVSNLKSWGVNGLSIWTTENGKIYRQTYEGGGVIDSILCNQGCDKAANVPLWRP